MLLRDKNFVSEVKHISIIENTIKGLFDGDIYYFNVHINGLATTYYIKVTLEAENTMAFRFKRDYNKFYTSLNYPIEPIKLDEEIKIITNCNSPILTSDTKIVEFNEDPATAMAKYVIVYLDALQTV